MEKEEKEKLEVLLLDKSMEDDVVESNVSPSEKWGERMIVKLD